MARQAVLFTPGDERRMVEKALTSDADMVILDIEDAVAPSEKDTACETIRDVLREWDATDITVEVSIRINPLEDRGVRDIELIADAGEKIENVVLPKVRGVGTLDDLEAVMADHGVDASIIPLIETASAVRYLYEIAEHPNVVAFEFGAEDYTTEIGGLHTDDRDEIIYARQKVVAAATAADIDAVDMAWPDFNDPDGLRKNSQQAVEMGFDGKSAIHPVQIEVIRDVFTPDPEVREWAERVIEAAEAAEAEGKVVFQLDGEMIDPPIIDRAADIIERAEAAE